MVTIDKKLESLQHNLLDKIENKTMSLSQITCILETLETVARLRELECRSK